jgi:endonuclease/exonuclease/phosphatase (EEP) superfamily protein YafD
MSAPARATGLSRTGAVLRKAAIGGLLTITAGVVALSLLPLAARVSYAAEMASHFRLQYLAMLALLLVPLFLLRRRLASIAVVTAMAVSFAPMAGYWLGVLSPAEPAHATEPGAARERLTVMTANLEARGHPPRRLMEIVDRVRPEVLVLTEFTPRWERSLAPLDEVFAHRYKMARRDPWGLAVYSRHELVSAVEIDLGESRAVEARVRTPGGKIVTVIGVHLRSPTGEARAAARNAQLELLAAHRASVTEPLVVTGDFNITPYSPYFRDWLAATKLEDARRGFGLDPSWPTYLPLLAIPIDHVAVSDDFLVTDHRRLPAFGSDHYPVLAELELR